MGEFHDESNRPPESVAARSLTSRRSLVEELYGRNESRLRLFVLGLLKDRTQTEDVIQQTFEKLLRHLDQEGDEHGPCEVTDGWLFRVAYHEVMQLRRQQGRARRHQPGLAWLREQMQGIDTTSYLSRERQQRVQTAIGSLPDSLGEIVRLRVFEELKFREIAETLNLPLGTVLTRMSRAMEQLRSLLRETD